MATLQKKCQPIELILSDVDGVLTDGRIVYDNQGIETKRFHVRDGLGIKLWQSAGRKFGIVTQRSSRIVKLRAGELDIAFCKQAVANKIAVIQEIAEQCDLEMRQICFIGDDLPDLPALRAVGLGIAVADAADELHEAADYTTERNGGNGAVREAIEMILKNQGLWDGVVQTYYN